MRLNRIAGYYGLDAVPGFLGRASDPSRTHFPELTGLRGIAILIVVAGHLLQRVERFYGPELLSGLETFVLAVLAVPFSGCRLLFCITGYTLAIHLGRHAGAASSTTRLGFLQSRLIRIWPPYIVILGSTLLFILATGYQPQRAYQFYAEPDSLALSFLVSAIYLHDLVFNTFPRLFPPGWYLEVHVQFLVAGPLLWSIHRKIADGRRRVLAAALCMVAATILAIVVSEHGPRGIRYSLAAFLPYFLIGAFLADLRRHRRFQHIALSLGRWPVGVLGLIAVIVLGAPCGALWWQLPAQLIALAAVMTACIAGSSRFRSAMAGRQLARIGIASFSIYLVHLQILQVAIPLILASLPGVSFLPLSLVCAMVGLGLVLTLALAFYWLVERPCVAYSLHKQQAFPPRMQVT